MHSLQLLWLESELWLSNSKVVVNEKFLTCSAALLDDTEIKHICSDYANPFSNVWDFHVYLEMVTCVQTVDTRPFFLFCAWPWYEASTLHFSGFSRWVYKIVCIGILYQEKNNWIH